MSVSKIGHVRRKDLSLVSFGHTGSPDTGNRKSSQQNFELVFSSPYLAEVAVFFKDELSRYLISVCYDILCVLHNYIMHNYVYKRVSIKGTM